MKRINENTKITLTVGQLKKLVKESTNEGVKDFEDVEVGDIVHRDGYDTLLFVVLDKGTARELMRFDISGAIEGGVLDGYIDREDPCVYTQSLKNGDKVVWVYGDGGVVAEWEMGNIKNYRGGR